MKTGKQSLILKKITLLLMCQKYPFNLKTTFLISNSKKKIIFKGLLKRQEEKFLFDTGTSAYELLTNKEVWVNFKSPTSKINIEKSEKSLDNVLTTYTTNCKQNIRIANRELPLNKVTYIEGFSQVQYSMMKFSGMTGMLGNKIFFKQQFVY